MKRTAIAIAVGALSIGLTQALFAQDDETQMDEQQQTTQQGAQESNPDQDTQGQGAEVVIDGEPDEATVEEAGEASVDVERAEEVEAEMHDPDEQDRDGAQQDQDEASQDQAAESDNLVSREVGEIEGYTVYSQEDDEEVGEVERVVRDTQNGDIYVVITKGGFLGFGKDEMGYTVGDLELRDDDHLVVSSSDDGESGDYGSDRYEDVDGSQTLREAMQSN
ncbi:PRC-barrel domain-containing protein [Halomonas urumqiensis]|nr:PRC-barrel domain-containing protein [Halomonas urumqiensis]GHE20813.1 hypothetical protein GCM10017767_13340 [Halomonas urumqiensis]